MNGDSNDGPCGTLTGANLLASMPAAVANEVRGPVAVRVLAGTLRDQHTGTGNREGSQPDRNHANYAPGRKQRTPADHRSVPVRERAYARLKSLILSDRFAPGQRLTEEQLAQEFGTSRTPIREALHKLESEGLITSLPTRGYVASQDSPQEMDELIELRAILEGHALRIICGRLTEPQFQALEEIVRTSEDALRRQRLEDLPRWNIRFHDTLHTLISDKRRLHHQLVTMRKYTFRYCQISQPGPDGNRRTVEEHRRILTALRFRDPDLSEYAMREHIQRSRGDRLQPEQEPFHQRAATDRRDRQVDAFEPR
jgi:DNA-binding GntR family transcriptional regulator